jgi:autophagy-related protein 9
MLNGLRGSSLLFSKNIIDEHDFYLKSDFINKMYYYYLKRGFFNIISTEIVNALISLFTISFIIFLYRCVDYHGIFDIKQNDIVHFSDYINLSYFFKLHWLIWVLVINYCIYLVCKIIGIFDSIVMYRKIRNFYRDTLCIPEWMIQTIKWEEIVNKLYLKYHNNTLNVYNIANRINIQDNYMVSIIDNDIIKLDCITNLMEWNLTYCILHKIFNDESKIHTDIFHNKEKYIESIKSRLKFVSVLNFIFMPFILIFIIFLNFFEYGATFYNKPSSIISYTWTKKGKWIIRDYNELYHNFHERLKKAEKPSIEYRNQFPNKLLETLLEFIVFTISSLFITLLILSFANENILVNLYLHGRSILWYLTIFGSVLTFCKALITNKIICYPQEKMIEIKKYIDCVPDHWIENSHSKETKKEFNSLFEYKISNIIRNICYTILVPFQMWNIYFKVDSIVTFIVDNSVKHHIMGYICKDSIFDNIETNTNLKTRQSYINFKNVNKEWL